MSDVFIGSEALLQGRLTPYQLRSRFRWIYPDVYLAAYSPPSLRRRSEAAWLWSGRRGVVAGLAAAALHGSNWIDDDEHVELIWRNSHPPAGIITRSQQLDDDEITRVARVPVTTPARTAYDLGRLLPRREAVARLDALKRSSPFSVEDVLLLAKRYHGARGLRQLRAVLPLVDGGAASPKETWLAAPVDQRCASYANYPDTGTRESAAGRCTRHGLGKVQSGGRIRRRSSPHQSPAICQGPVETAQARGSGVGRPPGDRGR
jgi:hypothetical protein